MKRSLIPLVVGALVAGALGASAAASIEATGWTRVSDPGAEASVGVARSRDGTLHVVWARAGAAFDTRVTATGKVGSRSGVVSGWASLSGPALVVEQNGTLRAFLSGSIRPGDIGPDIGIHTATAPPSGATWTLDPQAVWGGALGNQRDVSAVLGKDGQPVTAVGGSGAVFFKGVTRGQQETVLPPAPYSYDPEVAVDAASGAIVAGWFIDQGGKRGIVTQPVFPGGAQRFVGNADEAVDAGVSGRLEAPGVYVAVSSPTGVKLGKVGSTLRLIGKDAGVKAVDVTAGPDGRLWVGWLSTDGKLHAARSNRAASRFGAVQVVPAPGGSPTPFELNGEGSAGPLDAVARYSTGSALAWWHRQVLPPLTVTAKRNPATRTVTVAVSDVGDPVAGARVTVGGRQGRTDAGGRVAFAGLAATGSVRATAAGYAPGQASYR